MYLRSHVACSTPGPSLWSWTGMKAKSVEQKCWAGSCFSLRGSSLKRLWNIHIQFDWNSQMIQSSPSSLCSKTLYTFLCVKKVVSARLGECEDLEYAQNSILDKSTCTALKPRWLSLCYTFTCFLLSQVVAKDSTHSHIFFQKSGDQLHNRSNSTFSSSFKEMEFHLTNHSAKPSRPQHIVTPPSPDLTTAGAKYYPHIPACPGVTEFRSISFTNRRSNCVMTLSFLLQKDTKQRSVKSDTVVNKSCAWNAVQLLVRQARKSKPLTILLIATTTSRSKYVHNRALTNGKGLNQILELIWT